MMRYLRFLPILMVCAFTQERNPQPIVPVAYILAAGANHLPSAATYPNSFAYITDGNAPCDVTSAGGGTTLVPIKSDGTSWTCVGGGASITTALGSISGANSLPVTLAANNTYSMTLTGNVTTTQAATPTPGSFLSYSITQDGSGGHTFVFPSGFTNVPTIKSGANCVTNALFQWNVAGSAANFLGAYSPCTGALPPSLTAGCNGAGSSVNGGSSNQRGQFTTQTAAATTCTLTFATSDNWATAPFCVFTDGGATITPVAFAAGAISTTTAVVDFVSASNKVINYICQ